MQDIIYRSCLDLCVISGREEIEMCGYYNSSIMYSFSCALFIFGFSSKIQIVFNTKFLLTVKAWNIAD